MKAIVYLSLITLLVASCTTTKQVVDKPVETKQEIVTPPEGVEFTKVENFKGFAVINLPHSGLGFKKNMSVNVTKNQTDNGVFVPGVDYEGAHVNIWPTINSTEGDLDAQFEVVKKAFINHRIKNQPDAELIFEKKRIGNRDVALVKLRVVSTGQLLYGYIIPNSSKAALFLIDTLVSEPEKALIVENTMAEVMAYMIKTLAFQDKL